jgi:hypothetical protein
MSTPHTAPFRDRLLTLAALPLILVGLGADIWAGTMILGGATWPGILTHLPAALAWGLGLAVLDRDRSRTERLLGGRALAGLLLGLLLFPGLGALGYAVPALCLSLWRRLRGPVARARRRITTVEDFPEAPSAEPIPDSATLLRALHVQPFVEILGEADSERRRVVIGMLGREGGHDAVGLLRGLLNDPHPDIRSDAAVELTRLEDDLSRVLAQAQAQAQAHPADTAMQRELARQQVRYAHSGLLDGPSARYYLLQAREALLTAVTIDPDTSANWRAFAQVCHEIDDREGLQIAIDTLRDLGAANADETLLEMEVAYAERDWDRLRTLARRESTPAQEAEANAVLALWAGAGQDAHGRVA